MTAVKNQQRFETLLTSEVYQRAWGYCLRLCRNREDAEDLLQESLIRSYTRLRQLRDEGRFRAWLLSIVRRQFLDRYRRERLRPPVQSELPPQAPPEDPLVAHIAETLAQLPAPQRELIGLFYTDGLSLKETGQVLGIRPQVVRQRLYRARQALRRLLDAAPIVTRAASSRGGTCHETN